jgi:hypothetical protein
MSDQDPKPHHGRAAGGLACAVLALALAGCFGSGSSSSTMPGADPASILPASTLAYVQAVVRPTGTLASDIDAASARLLGIADPGQRLDALIDRSAAKGVTYEKDIRPWLGARVAIALLSAGKGGTDYVVVLDQDDPAKAQAAIANKALWQSSGSTTTGSYRGVSYTEDETKQIAGVVGQYVVVANDAAAFDATVDVQKGANSLASATDYQQALGDQLSDAAGSAYVPLRKLVDVLSASLSSSTERTVLSAVDGMIGNGILDGSVRLDASGALLDLGTRGTPSSAASASSTSSPQTNPIGSLPADSLLAIGATHVGSALLSAIEGIGSLSSSLSEIQLATGIDIRGDLDSITTAGFFLSGASTASLQAALVLGLDDPAKAPTLLGQLYKLVTLVESVVKGVSVGSFSQGTTSSFTVTIKGLTQPIVIAAAGGRIVVALGQSSLAAATSSGTTLSAAGAFKRASALLGSGVQPDTYVNLSAIGAIASGAGTGASSSLIAELQRLGAIVVGTGKVGGSERLRIAIPGGA